MRIYFILFIISTLAILNIVNAQTYFQKGYYKAGKSDCYDGKQTSDSGFILVGEIQTDTIMMNDDIGLIKTDSHGDTIWTRSYGGTDVDAGEAVCQTSDGGYIVTGISYSNGGYGYLLKTDGQGNVDWMNDYIYIAGHMKSHRVIQTDDGGYLMAGNRDDSIHTAFLIKTDSAGYLSWSRTLADDSVFVSDRTKGLIQSSDGNYLLTLNRSSQVSANRFLAVIKFDNYGDTIWTKTFKTNYGITAEEIKQTLDGGYVLTGNVFDKQTFRSDVLVIRLDSSGDLLWSKQYDESSGNEAGHSIICESDGSFYIGGESGQWLSSAQSGMIMKVDSAGNVLYYQLFENHLWTTFQSIQKTFDNNLVAIGYSAGLPNYIITFDLIKTNLSADLGCYFTRENVLADTVNLVPGNALRVDSFPILVHASTTSVGGGCIILDACLNTRIDEPDFDDEITIYPNPTSQAFTIDSKNYKIKECIIFDPEFRFVSEISCEEGRYVWNNNLPCGMYLVRVTLENNAFRYAKIIKN